MKPLTLEEKREEATRILERVAIDPLGEVGVSKEEKAWFRRNGNAVLFHYRIVGGFVAYFDRRVKEIVPRLQRAGVMEDWVAELAVGSYQQNERGMQELALRLAESAEKLPDGK